MRRTALRVALAVAALVATSGAFAQATKAGFIDVPPGSIASDPLLKTPFVDLDDRARPLPLRAGRPTIVNFWARWCGPCKTELPELVALHAREPAIDVVGINIESDAAAVRDFARAYDIDYPTLLARGRGIDLMRALGNPNAGLPFTVVLDGQGRVVALRLGAMTRAELDAVVARLRP